MDTGINESSVPASPFELFDEWLSFAFEVGIFNANAMALATVGVAPVEQAPDNQAASPSVRNILGSPVPASPASGSPVPPSPTSASPVPASPASASPTPTAICAFYTDAGSQKAQELANNPRVAAVFSWLVLERQVRLVGSVLPLSDTAVADYLASRPPAAQIAMRASAQSEQAPNRAALENRFAEVAAAASVDPGPTDLAPTEPAPTEPAPTDPTEPAHKSTANWVGFLLVPHEIEFWQGRSDRIHDRLVYRQAASPHQAAPPRQEPEHWLLERLQP